jgi:hypothetical protein
MNDLSTAGADTPAAEVTAPAVETPATVETSEATTEQQAPEAETPEAADDTGDKPKKKHWAHERIDELTRQRREAERQAEFWKARATQSVDPSSLDYEEGIAERTIQRTRQEQAETATATAALLAQEAFSYREAEARDKFADYDAVTRNPNVAITTDMASLIRDSEHGPEMAYHLGKNPAEAARIAALPAIRQAAELGKLEVALSAPKPARKVPAAPVQPVSGIAAGGAKDPAAMSMSEYAAWRKSGGG